MAGSRPAGVTFVAVLVWIQALFYVIAGVFALFGVPIGLVTFQVGVAGTALLIGIIEILFGIITFAVAFGLLRGSRVARMIITILLVFSLVGGIIQLTQNSIAGGIISLAISIIGILLLWAGRAGAFFRG